MEIARKRMPNSTWGTARDKERFGVYLSLNWPLLDPADVTDWQVKLVLYRKKRKQSLYYFTCAVLEPRLDLTLTASGDKHNIVSNSLNS